MTDHPLTDDTIENIYHSACGADGMLRAAADWQLEQVIDWIKKKRGGTINLHNSEINNLVVDLKKAMRPQLEETNS